MRFYDLADFEPDGQLAKRLGYNRIFRNGDALKLSGRPEPNTKTITNSNNQQVLLRSLADRNTIGIAFSDNKPDAKVVVDAAEKGKPIFFISASLLIGNHKDIQKSLYSIRKLFRVAKKARAKTGILTFARSKEQLLSVMQLIEIAKLIGADETEAKKMISMLGDAL